MENQQKELDANKLKSIYLNAAYNNFYGRIILTMDDGNLTFITKEQKLKKGKDF